jgi:hypothetical protein
MLIRPELDLGGKKPVIEEPKGGNQPKPAGTELRSDMSNAGARDSIGPRCRPLGQRDRANRSSQVAGRCDRSFPSYISNWIKIVDVRGRSLPRWIVRSSLRLAQLNY